MNNIRFELDRDIVFFDIESTGLNIIKDRILQIALIKYPRGGGEPTEMSMMINPGFPISEEAFAIHGISNEMLRNKPTFEQVGPDIYKFIGDADLAGYNSDRFDVPMLMEEFHRIGISLDISVRKLIDVQKIFYKMEPRTLKAAYKHYCDQTLEDAHDALADVKATVEVFRGQLQMYKDVDYVDGDGFVTEKPIQNNIDAIAAFLKDHSMLDVTNRLKYNSKGQVIFNFGKYAGQVVADVFKIEPNYYHWIVDKDFSVQVKFIVTQIFEASKK
jgi:DNA polymerase III subunit epsilon